MLRSTFALFCLAIATLSAAGGDECVLCNKAIPAGKGVVARVGNDTRHYRCIHCALTGLKGEKAVFAIRAKTPLDHRTVKLIHRRGVWTQEPSTTVFLILPERSNECLDVHQPFVSKDEFDRYLAKNPSVAAQKPKAYTIADYEKMLKVGAGK